MRQQSVFEEHKESKITQYGIGTGYLFAVVSTNVCTRTRVLWPRCIILKFHQTYVESAHLKN